MISGKVFALSDGKPLKQVSLKARYSEPNSKYPKTIYSKSDKKGSFNFHLNNKGDVKIEAWLQDYVLETLNISAEDTEDTVVFKLSRGEEAKFRLLQPIPHSDPAIVSDKKLEVVLKPSSTYNKSKYSTDGDGLFSVTGIKKGDQVELRVPGYVRQSITPDRQGRRLDILLMTATTLKVKVIDEQGKPLTNVYFRNDKGKILDHSYDSQKKKYELKGLTSGSFTLSVRKSDYQTKELSLDLSLYGNPVQVVELSRKPAYSFVIKNIETSALPESISLKISDSLSNSSHSRNLRRAKEAELPTYEYSADKPLGAISAQITVKGYLPTAVNILPEQFSYELNLDKGLGFTAQVNDENGSPISNVSINLNDKLHRHSTHFKSDA
jgi:hypothetical protein